MFAAMKLPRPLASLLVVLGLMWPAHAFAWGDEAHVAIAMIAERLLDPAVKAKVDAILAADPDTLTGRDMASRATWADKLRDASRDAMSNRGTTGTEKWHYTNIELDRPDIDYACYRHPQLAAGTPASQGPAKACSIDKVEQFTGELANPATAPQERLLALKFLLHLVGDLHQPLHSADNHDGGGAGIFVVAAGMFRPIRLHEYWDTEVIRLMGRNPRAVADSVFQEFGGRWNEWVTGGPADWAMEAFQKARTVAYAFSAQAGIEASGKPVYTIDARYQAAALATAREQVAKAGVRLAGLLNGALK